MGSGQEQVGGRPAVIDNEKITLHDYLREVMPHARRASIAVGYFYVSGFGAIMNSFKRIEASSDPGDVVRLLISPTTNRPTAEALLASHESYESVKKMTSMPRTVKEGMSAARNDFSSALEYMPQIKADRDVVQKMAELIRKKKLQIKVYTRDRLHAKAYIFELDGQGPEGESVVGSSNLSISGIKNHAELNLRTDRREDSLQLLEWFDRHWDDEGSVEFTCEIAEMIDESWAGDRHTPEDIYNKAAWYENKDLLSEIEDDDEKTRELFDFQRTAVGSAIKKLEMYGGVIIADVVGIGKSYIGSAIMKYLKETNRSKPLVICPPHLEDMWRKYVRDFGVHADVVSRYKIGMGEKVLEEYNNCDVVLVDESHNFRNTGTNSYEALLSFMEEKTDEARIIMLSATPISNGITDMKNQLKLFPRDMLMQAPPLANTDLDEYFKGLEDQRGRLVPGGAEKVRELLKYVLIRRTRTQIQEHAKKDGDRYYLERDGERKYFPGRLLKNPEEYDADKVYERIDEIERCLGGLKLSRYTPGNYILSGYLEESHPEHKKYSALNNTTVPLAGLIRTSLLKRMESSIAAFATSVRNLLEGHREFLRQLESGRVPIGREFSSAIYERVSSDRDLGEYEKKIEGISSEYSIDAFDVAAWTEEIRHDIRVFESIRDCLAEETRYAEVDDKLHTLERLVKGLGNDKMIIFTESKVTAEYIYEYLKKALPGRKLAQIDSVQGKGAKNKIIERFDPVNNNASVPDEAQIDILVSTDVLSEGVNLQSARTVINYDFHWNPVRLIQRVGRVDRIGSRHPRIDIINFLPTRRIDSQLGLQDRVARKINTIRDVLGYDQQVLDSTERFDPDAVARIYDCDGEVLNSEMGGLLNLEESKAERDAGRIKEDRGLMQRIEAMPFGIRGAPGRGSLLIACEAEEILTNKRGARIRRPHFRRHYEVTGEGVRPVWASAFLKKLGDNAGGPSGGRDPLYYEFVARGWEAFNHDMSDTMARSRPLKHQKYFEKRLTRIARNPGLRNDAIALLPFVRQMMIPNYQPYKSMAELHRRLERDRAADEDVLAGLGAVQSRHGGTRYHRQISKPRILYSMMVGA